MGIKLATIYGADAANGRLILLGSMGIDDADIRRYRTTPLIHSHPGGTTVLNSETIWMSLRALAERYPLAATDARSKPWFDTGDMISLPVTSRGSSVGTIFLVADREFPRTWAFHDVLGSVSHAVVPWILLQRDAMASVPGELPRTSPLAITARERAILSFVGEGLTNAEIANRLGYSEATVRADLSRLGRLLGLSGRREVLRKMTELGL